MFNPWQKMALLIGLVVGLGIIAPEGAPAKTIPAQEIRALISDHVDKNMPWPAGTVRLTFPMSIADPLFTSETVRCAVESRPGESYIGDTSFMIKFYAGYLLLKQENVRVTLEVQKDVVVAAAHLVRNKAIAEADVTVEKRWLKRLPLNALNNTAEAIGKATVLNIRQDAEITRNMLKEPLLVKRGGMVRIMLEEGQLHITTIGVSEEDGIAAAVIKVKNVSSNKILYARVVGDSMVRVDF
jgi:flagella basal body P-ring formation protein FlgA